MAIELVRWDPALKIVALRFSNVMDPADYAEFPSFDDDARARKWNLWGYIDARDGAQAIRRALEWDTTGFDRFIIAAADTVMTAPERRAGRRGLPGCPPEGRARRQRHAALHRQGPAAARLRAAALLARRGLTPQSSGARRGALRGRGPAVDALDHVGEVGEDHVALDAQLRRQVAARLGEVRREDRRTCGWTPPARRRRSRDRSRAGSRRCTAGFTDASASVMSLSSPLLASQVGSISVSRVTRAAMNGFWSPTTITWLTSGLARIGILERGGRDVLAAGRDDDLLLAAGDREEAVGVERAEVAGAEPAVVERRCRRLGVLPVLLEDVDALHLDLAVVGEPQVDARAGRARPCRS